MNLPPKLLKLLTHHQHIFSKHLDDTLLNRLETCLYCLHSTHASFWKALEARHLDAVLDSLEQLPDDIELACGLLKIKFAIVWHFRSDLNETVSSRVSSLLEKLLTSEDPLIICAVGRFMKSVLMEPKTLATFHEIHSTPLIPALRRSYDLSENIVHRKALLNSLLFLLFSQICAQKDIPEDAIDGLLQFSQSAKNSVDPFHIDFCTHIVKFSECLQSQPANLLLAKLSSLVEAVLTALPSTLSADALEDSLYLLLVSCPLLSKNLAAKVCAEVLPLSNGRVAVRTLRRALVNDVLRESYHHRTRTNIRGKGAECDLPDVTSDVREDAFAYAPGQLLGKVGSLDHPGVTGSCNSLIVDLDYDDDIAILTSPLTEMHYVVPRREVISDPERKETYVKMKRDDERRWNAADMDFDNKLSIDEFAAFLHPQDYPRMRNVVIEETLQSVDKDGDGYISLDEYLTDLSRSYQSEYDPKKPLADWAVREKDQFFKHRDKNGDKRMDRTEVGEWIMPTDYDPIEAEAKHLIYHADKNKDGKLSEEEVVSHQSLFVGSQALNYGRPLGHEEL
nr:unnamed protein product [Spirometra erinaceieuropaei]